MSQNRKLKAIIFADIVGYTALMQSDEEKALQFLGRFKETLEKETLAHKGKIEQYYGDGCLMSFDSSTLAVNCAIALQKGYGAELKVPVRIGIHLGEVIYKDGNVYGDGVNVASRIESAGVPGSVLLSHSIRNQIKNKSAFPLVSLGTFDFKNVHEPVHLYAISKAGLVVPDPGELSGKFKASAKKKHSSLLKYAWLFILTALLIAAIAYLAFNQDKKGVNSKSGKPSIAVLPFDSYDTNTENQFFAEAIADEVRSQLLSFKEMKVISGYSSKYYKGQNVSLKQVGEELGVEYLLQGKVQKLPNSVKVAVELSHTQTNNLEWAPTTFERKMEDLFRLENDIASQIVDRLQVHLTKEEQAELAVIPSENPEAYQLFLQGQELMYRNRTNFNEIDQAIELFEQATSLDPTFDRAYLSLAEAYLDFSLWGRISAHDAADEALNAIFRISSGHQTAEYFGVLGAINLNRREKDLAKQFLERSLAMNPNYLLAKVRLAWINFAEDNLEEANALLGAAHELDPKNPTYYGLMGYTWYYDRQFEKGLATVREGLALHPEDNFLKWTLGYIYSGMGEYEKAIETFTSRSVGRQTNWMIGYCYAKIGETENARFVLDYLLNRRQQRHVPAHMIASIYIGLEEYEKALDWLEIDVKEGGHEHFYWGMKSDVKYDPIRGKARFRALLEEINSYKILIGAD